MAAQTACCLPAVLLLAGTKASDTLKHDTRNFMHTLIPRRSYVWGRNTWSRCNVQNGYSCRTAIALATKTTKLPQVLLTAKRLRGPAALLWLMWCRVAVSCHPGRTKHYQTHFMSNRMVLCDCPGIVFPRLDVSLPMQVGGVQSTPLSLPIQLQSSYLLPGVL